MDEERTSEAISSIEAGAAQPAGSDEPPFESPGAERRGGGRPVGRRVADAFRDKEQPTRRIQSSDDALAFCRDHFARLVTDQAKEEFHIVCLDAKHDDCRFRRKARA